MKYQVTVWQDGERRIVQGCSTGGPRIMDVLESLKAGQALFGIPFEKWQPTDGRGYYVVDDEKHTLTLHNLVDSSESVV